MAMTTLSTPKTPLNKKVAKLRNFTAPTTPKHLSTPKTSKNVYSSNTPECFSKVVIETPQSKPNKKSIGKEKSDELRNLSVAVRIRPMNTKELSHIGASNVVNVKGNELYIKSSPIGSSNVNMDHMFQYDHIFWSCDENNSFYSTQEEVFLTLGKPLLDSAFKGYNGCLFAYGQTGSGKSFSMMGRDCLDVDSEEFSGIIPRFCRSIFERLEHLPKTTSASLEVSYFEIYNEKIHDLLLCQDNGIKTALKVREHPEWGPYVVDLSVHKIKTYKELRNWLLIGNNNRATAATSMNEKSSRSHSIFSIEISLSDDNDEGHNNSKRSKVSLIDLAGSERLSNSHNSEEKIRQGVSINKSLLTLGKVISSLADQKKNQFVPYRESVLTWLLKESLGGNSLTSMLATISPSNLNVDESLATLRYACQARSIVNRARVNEDPHDRLIRELRSEVERLRALSQSYERTSLGSSSSSLVFISDFNNSEELDDLKNKLSETENKLRHAEKSWEQRFKESKEAQEKELLEANKKREVLESKVRIMKMADQQVKLSPYRSNFLEELEDILCEDVDPNKHEIIEHNSNFDILTEWCRNNFLVYSVSRNSLLIIDYKNNKQTIVSVDDLEKMREYGDVNHFLKNLTWDNIKANNKLSKADVMKSMNQVYQLLSELTPPEEQQETCLLYAKVNKILQKFESALLNVICSNKPEQRSVTFQL